MPLHIDMRKERSITVIRAVGTIYHQDGALEIRQCLVRCMGEGDSNLLLEAHGIHGMDESGVDALRESQEDAKRAGGDLKIAGARYWFLASLALHTARSTFPYYAATEDAISSFAEADGSGPRGVRHFDILEFVKEQEAEAGQQNAAEAPEHNS